MTDWRREIVRGLRGSWTPDAPLAPRTTIRVGGPAELLALPGGPGELVGLLAAARRLGIPVSILGGGADTLVADRGVRGLVIRLPPELGEEAAEDDRLLLPAGAPIARLAARGHARGLVGAEFTAGIPGTLGGAVALDAGTRAGELRDLLLRAELATADGIGFVPAAALGLGYRSSRLPAGAVVTRLEVRLRPGDVAASRAAMAADLARRRETQPLDQPTFGSTFRNPPGGFAGALLEAAGLKGHRLGGAAWSERHANFVVNLGGATAADVLGLLALARRRVRERAGVHLEAEVRLLGEFEPAQRAEFEAA